MSREPLLETDLSAALAQLDEDDLESLQGLYSALASTTVGGFAAALRAVVVAEQRRRASGEDPRPVDWAEVVAAASEFDASALDEGRSTLAATEGAMRRLAEWHGAVGRVLLLEALHRAAFARFVERQLGADVEAGWGWDPRRDQADTPEGDDPAGPVGGEA